VKVELLTLCDYAVSVPGGKLTIVGTFDRLAVPRLPYQQPSCFLVAKVRFASDEDGERRLKFIFTDPDGKEIGALPEVKIPVKMRDDEYTAAMQAVLRINGLPVAQAGDHTVHLLIDDNVVATALLTIQVAKPRTG
jgi:hypothetical protein